MLGPTRLLGFRVLGVLPGGQGFPYYQEMHDCSFVVGTNAARSARTWVEGCMGMVADKMFGMFERSVERSW